MVLKLNDIKNIIDFWNGEEFKRIKQKENVYLMITPHLHK